MTCPRCGKKGTKVYGTVKGFIIIRYRRCDNCNYHFQTKEMPVVDLLAVEYMEYLKEIGEVESEEIDKVTIKVDDA